jgi:hypothetical protein
MVITFLPKRNTIHKIKPISPPRLKASLKFVQMYLFLKCAHKIEVPCVIITNTKFHGWETSKRVSFHTSLKKNVQTNYASPLSVLALILNCIVYAEKFNAFVSGNEPLSTVCCSSITELRVRQSENWHTQPQNITCLNATTSETWRSHGASLKAAVLWCDVARTPINWPFQDEAQTALFKDPVHTAL